jgi:excisionase family DNA binding protein
MQSNEQHSHLAGLARDLAAILADALVKDVRTELLPLIQSEHHDVSLSHMNSLEGATDLTTSSLLAAPRTLWTLKELALDSRIKVSTWRRWILERRIACVRIGRSVRIKDEDYRKLIQKGYRKAML